jgi:tetratricopeptide (TPR) repeat protein
MPHSIFRRRWWLPALAALVIAPALDAQAPRTEPRRPKVEAGMDTNDAQAYLLAAVHQVDNRPEISRAAYYWAARLDPGSAQAWYGYYVSSVLADDGMVRLFLRGPSNAKDRAELRRLDSLSLRAELLDPFLTRNLEGKFVARFASVLGVAPQDLGTVLSRQGDLWFARVSMWDGQWPLALDGFARALRNAREKSPIHALRGFLFQQMGRPDSAIASLKAAVAEGKKVEDTALVRFFQPKARYLYQLGWLHEALGKVGEARDFYGQALVEDLAFYPAHQRLGLLALAASDTATALTEFDVAVQAGPDDVVLRLQYAYALAASRKLAEASQQVQAVIQREPYYADPYLMLARLYDATDMPDLAVVNYKAFLDRAPASDVQRTFASERAAALAKAAGAP